MPAPSERAALTELLALNQIDRGDLHVVLDGARDDAVHALTREIDGPWAYLEDGIVEASYQVAAPRVLALEHWPAQAIARLLDRGWGHSWGVFLRTSHEFPVLRRHLQTLSNVRLPNGRLAQFRFYDPRVLRSYLPTCTADELALVYGPIQEFVLEGEEPTSASRYVLERRRLVIETVSLD